jgi:hypothetical protein
VKHFEDATHALYVGWVLGLAMRQGLPLYPVVDEDGDYTDELRFELPIDGDDTFVLTLTVPPPPDDWRFDGP